jgi:hypothetical protein
MGLKLAIKIGQRNMGHIFAGTHQNVRTSQASTKNLINQAITHSMIKADDALKKEQYNDAHKFYKYALRLSEMQFGDQDSIVKNLRLLLRGIDEFLSQGAKKSQMTAELGWRRITD